MAPAPPSVFGFLSASANARTAGALDLGFGRSAALWRNHRDHLVYDGAEGHTFSLYVEGGHGTRRVDRQAGTGRPGALCVMPHRHRSEWEISSPFGFVHLYVPADELGRAFAETFDRDARLLDVAEVTFAEAPRLAAVLRGVARAVAERDALAAEAAVGDVLALFLADGRWGGARPRALKGGLAPFVGRRIDDYVEANLHRTIRLADLAGVAGLRACLTIGAGLRRSPFRMIGRRRAKSVAEPRSNTSTNRAPKRARPSGLRCDGRLMRRAACRYASIGVAPLLSFGTSQRNAGPLQWSNRL